MNTLVRTFRRCNPPPTRQQKIALVAGVVAGALAALLWLHLDRPAWCISPWAIGGEMAVAVLPAFTAAPGYRWRRLWVSSRFFCAATPAALTTAAVGGVHGDPAHLALYGTALVCTLAPLLMAAQEPGDPVTAPRSPWRLSGLDSAFYSGERPGVAANCLAVMRLRPGPAPLDVTQLRAHVAERLPGLPAFGRRVMGVPLGLGHPIYVDDPDFDLTRHVDEHILAAPGTEDVLDAYLAEQTWTNLDRSRPLWRLTLISGLADGRQVALLNVHHCVTDGFALLNTLHVLVSDVGSGCPDPAAPPPAPSAGQRLVDGLADQARTLGRLPALIRATRASSAAAKKAIAASPVPLPKGRDTAMCRPYRPFTGHNTIAFSTLAVPDLKQVQHAAGVTLNDVVLALVAEAMRGYLSARDSLPTPSLVANVPVGLDRPNGPLRTTGNRVGFLKTTLGTDIADPWQRLITIGAVTARAKRVLIVRGPELLDQWLDQIPPFVVGSLQRLKQRQLRRDRQQRERRWNIIVSHIREQRPMGALAGTPIEGMHFVGPANDGGTTLNVVIAGYGDVLHLTVLAVEAAGLEPRELIDGMHRALDELLALARGPLGIVEGGDQVAEQAGQRLALTGGQPGQ